MAVTVPSPPFNGENTTFKNPLQPGYRDKMVAWLQFMYQYSAQLAAAAGITYTIPDTSTMSDSKVTQEYVTAWHVWNIQLNKSADGKVGHISALDPVSNPVNAVVDATVSIPDFLGKLSSGALWLRVAEVLIGLLLVGIGLEKVSNITIPGPVGSVIHSGKG